MSHTWSFPGIFGVLEPTTVSRISGSFPRRRSLDRRRTPYLFMHSTQTEFYSFQTKIILGWKRSVERLKAVNIGDQQVQHEINP